MFQEELEDNWYTRSERDEEMQIRTVRLNTLCRVYEQADRVLSGDPVVVNVAPTGPAPAWSDGASIWLNAEMIEEIDMETLTQVNGLNYHELAHHLYTPRRGTDLVKWVMENNYLEAMNMLEDQRIETLLTARYPSVAPYLTATVSRWLANTPEEGAYNYVLVRGRRYLPLEIREGFRDIFFNPDLLQTIAEIVDEYRLLAFPKDYDRARVLIKRFADEVVPNMPQMPKGPNGCTQRDAVVKGRPEPGKAQAKDAQRAEASGQKGEKVPAPNTNKPAQPSSADEALDLRSEAQKQAEKAKGQGAKPYGEGHSESVGGIPKDLSEALSKTIQQVLDRKDVQQDVKTKQKVIVGGDGKHDDVVKKGKYDSTPVPDYAIQTYRKFARELERLRDECEPTWHRQEASGKLNVQRAIRGCEIDEAFDRWDEGTDGSDVEAVILVDRSGSMSSGSNDMHASVACWTIKRGLEQIGAPVTVYAFDDKAELAYNRTEHVDKTRYKFIYGNGGTDPYTSLVAAEQLLLSSRKKNKMLFIITDGAFNENKNDEIIERIGKRGVLTAMTLIMDDHTKQYYLDRNAGDMSSFRHKAEIFAQIESAQDLLPFAKAVVTGAIKKRGR